ncbi:DUF748 domain-containing protein [Pollutibacter soli]|uniref:DUF748 domain-containing protein n=1 Tax=Pollutibacter soli TaxID=3034157 RepID=UPI003013F006
MGWKNYSKKKKIVLISLGLLISALIVFRLFLPSIVLKYVNRQLTMIDGYVGHVEDIDIALWRGAYQIKKIKLDKTGGNVPVPFFQADLIDLSVEWKTLFHGKIVAEIETENPKLNFVKGPSRESSQTKIDKDWTIVIDKLIPFRLNRFEINNGEIHYRDFHSSPKVDLHPENIHILAENLSNAKRKKNDLPSTALATARVYDGDVTLNMKLNPLNKVPTFDMNTKMTAVTLVKLNDFLKAYGNFDVEKGTISLYTEAAAKDGKIAGYTKPIIKDLKVASWKEDKDNPVKFLWESLVEAVGWVLTNKIKDQVATRAEFVGRADKPEIDIWSLIGQLLRNAFIEALYPALENSVSIGSVDKKEEKKSFFKRLFGTKDKNETIDKKGKK